MTAPTWERFSFTEYGYSCHYAIRTDKHLDDAERAFGLQRMVPPWNAPDCRSEEELKARIREQDALDAKYRGAS